MLPNSVYAEHQYWSNFFTEWSLCIDRFDPALRFQVLHQIDQYISLHRPPAYIMRQAIDFVGHLCDWRLQLTLIESLEAEFNDRSDRNLETKARALWKTGDWQSAYELLERGMLLNPDNQPFYELYLALIEAAAEQGFSYYRNDQVSELVYLEPLSHHHAEEFFLQYWDQSIAALCCLPNYRDKLEWHAWLVEQVNTQNQTTYAVQHQRYGFIGVVNMLIYSGVGFFYYWIGKDFRGQGIGQAATSLLLDLSVSCLGLSECYAKAYKHNHASINALQKSGFKKLAVNALPPHDNEVFFYLGEQKTEQELITALLTLLKDMDSEIKLDFSMDWKPPVPLSNCVVCA